MSDFKINWSDWVEKQKEAEGKDTSVKRIYVTIRASDPPKNEDHHRKWNCEEGNKKEEIDWIKEIVLITGNDQIESEMYRSKPEPKKIKEEPKIEEKVYTCVTCKDTTKNPLEDWFYDCAHCENYTCRACNEICERCKDAVCSEECAENCIHTDPFDHSIEDKDLCCGH